MAKIFVGHSPLRVTTKKAVVSRGSSDRFVKNIYHITLNQSKSTIYQDPYACLNNTQK